MASAISLQHVSFQLRNGDQLFTNITAQFSYRLQALVGINGVGKSVLGKIICHDLIPESGSVSYSGSLAYVPQQWEGRPEDSILEVLGLADAIASIEKIQSNTPTDEDFDRAEGWWDWQTQLDTVLKTVGFTAPLNIDRSIGTFSGGEQVRILWASALLKNSDWIIFDEPTNHLDAVGRKTFLDWLSATQHQCLLITHDRALLDQVEAIFELTPTQVIKHVGDYEQFLGAKQTRWKTQQTQLSLARREQKRIANKAQEALEKQQQRAAQGKATAANRNWSKLEKDAAKEAAQNALKNQKRLRENRKQTSASVVERAEVNREWFDPIEFELNESYLPDTKKVLSLSEAQAGYDEALHLPLNLNLHGSFRLHIKGPNGSGKSALLKAIAGRETLYSGDSQVSVSHRYLDQHFNRFKASLRAVDIVLSQQPQLTNQQARDRLALLRLRNIKADVPFGQLSGGEQLKVVLVSQLLSLTPPQLLLLDEPTNHLDLDSLHALENALSVYKGAIIVVSHDDYFVKSLSITHEIELTTGTLTTF